MSKRVAKTSVLVAVTGFLMAFLAGCATKSLDVAVETPFSVQRTSYDAWTGDSQFSYADSEGHWVPFAKCESVNIFFGTRQCVSEGGSIIFEWTNGKGGRINSPSIQAMGERYEVDCFYDEANPSDDIRICVPRSN